MMLGHGRDWSTQKRDCVPWALVVWDAATGELDEDRVTQGMEFGKECDYLEWRGLRLETVKDVLY